MSESINTVVIGAGVIGLAVARALARSGREVIVLERNAAIGMETSSRNSEVIHAGIYYAHGSLKAQLCVSGKQQLYRYCEQQHIEHRRIGKLIVATREADLPALQSLAKRAAENGVGDLQWLDADAVKRMEPAVSGAAALFSPSTGIVDSHGLMQALQADLEAAGGSVALNAELVATDRAGEQTTLLIRSGEETMPLLARTIVNCAGLHATQVARMLHQESHAVPATRYARGCYFAHAGTAPFSHLVYPLPQPGGLGVHATLDLAGAVRFGPDVEWVDEIGYDVDAQRAETFAAAIREYWPAVDAAQLTPAYAGIRPKLAGPGEPAADFRIDHTQTSTQTVVDLFGIESPGLTSSLAIAEHVAALISAD